MHDDDDHRAEGQLADDVVGDCQRGDDAEERAEHDPDERAECRHDDRLPAHRSTELAAVHADGPEQPDLPCPLEDAQRQRDRECRGRRITIDSISKIVIVSKSWLIWSSWLLRNSGVGLHVGLREVGGGGGDREIACFSRDAVSELADDEEVACGRIADRLECVEADQPVCRMWRSP